MRRRRCLTNSAGRRSEYQLATRQYYERTKQPRTTLPAEEVKQALLCHIVQPEPDDAEAAALGTPSIMAGRLSCQVGFFSGTAPASAM